MIFSLFTLNLSGGENWKTGDLIYLASFPRSGNQWVRNLLEESTRIATGSVYPEAQMVGFNPRCYCKKGYNGLFRCPKIDEIVVVKTHYPAVVVESPYEQLPYSLTIRFIRHPLDSFYSFYVLNQRTKGAEVEEFIPQHLLGYYIKLWRRFQRYWNRQVNVLTVRYEDLYNSPEQTLKKVLQATQIPYNESNFEEALRRFPPTGGLLKHFAHYRPEDLELVEKEIGSLMRDFGY